jgi:hypothetical protein
LHGFANPAYIRRFLCSPLPSVAPYCVPGGVRVVSISPSYPGNTVSSTSSSSEYIPSTLCLIRLTRTHLINTRPAGKDVLQRASDLGKGEKTPPAVLAESIQSPPSLFMRWLLVSLPHSIPALTSHNAQGLGQRKRKDPTGTVRGLVQSWPLSTERPMRCSLKFGIAPVQHLRGPRPYWASFGD